MEKLRTEVEAKVPTVGLVIHHLDDLVIQSLTCGGAPPTDPPPAPDESKSTKTRSAWGGKVADLSKERGQESVPQWAFIGFSLHRNTGKAHQSLSGSKDQTTDNI